MLAAGVDAIVLPDHLVHDIDDEGDWERAEIVFAALRGHQAVEP